MTRRAPLCAALTALCLTFPAARTQAAGLDWEVEEKPTGAPVQALRNVRDGLVGLLDGATDLQLAVFSEASLLLSTVLMASSDAIGCIDDNPWSQHVFKGVGSKSLAKTAYLLHLAGTEAVLGSHGLEAESWAAQALDDLNPLLDDEEKAGLPLDPLAFVGEGMVHVDVYRARVPGRIAATALAADGALRPVGSVLRMAGLTGPAKQLETRAQTWMRGALEP